MLKGSIKLIALLMVVFVIFSALAGCTQKSSQEAESSGSDSKAPDEKKVSEDLNKGQEVEKSYTITQWMFPMGSEEKRNELWQNIVKGFEESNPGLKVKIQTLPWSNRDQKMLTAMAANRGPDCAYLNPDILYQFAFNNLLVPLDDFITDEMKSDFTESSFKTVSFDGKTYGVPMLLTATFYIYNLDLLGKIGLDENSLPKTYGEYEDVLKKLKEQGIHGTYIDVGRGGYMNTFYNHLWAEGSNPIMTADGKVNIDRETGKKVIERFVRWYKEGYMPEDAVTVPDAMNQFLSQKVASYYSSTYIIEGDKEREALDKFNWAIGPALSGDAGTYTYGTVGSFGITKDCKDSEATFKWIQWITNKENMTEFLKLTGFFPPRKSIPDLFEGKRGYDKIIGERDNLHGEIAHPAGRELHNNITPLLQAAFLDEKTADEVLDEINTEAEKIVQRLDAIRPPQE